MHHHVLVMSALSVDGNLGYVLLLDTELIVARQKDFFGENSRTIKLVKKVIYPGQRATVILLSSL